MRGSKQHLYSITAWARPSNESRNMLKTGQYRCLIQINDFSTVSNFPFTKQ